MFTVNTRITRSAILLIMALLAGIPAIHKITGGEVPEWFIKKFSDSLIDYVPGGITFSFILIVILESLIPLCFLIALSQGEKNHQRQSRFGEYGFLLSLLLFAILFFGSFLIENYDNGFNDFMYFCATLYLRNEYHKLKPAP